MVDKATEIKDVLLELQKLGRHVEALSRDVASLYMRIQPHQDENREEFFASLSFREEALRLLPPAPPPTLKTLLEALRKMDGAIEGMEYDFRFLRSRIQQIENNEKLELELKKRIRPRKR